MGLVHSGLTPSIPTEGPKERPILFSGPMVLALLLGGKTQTRRVVKPMPKWADRFPICKPDGMAAGHEIWWWDGEFDRVGVSQDCPYGKPGDRLWVKETWRPTASLQAWDMDVTYRADGERRTVKDGEFGDRDWNMPKAAATGNVSPLFMPRWASRLTLEITDVRCERLNDCSEADAEAEGTKEPSLVPIIGACWSERDAYAKLWEAINGPGSWAVNPWVWAVSFNVIEPAKPASTNTEGA